MNKPYKGQSSSSTNPPGNTFGPQEYNRSVTDSLDKLEDNSAPQVVKKYRPIDTLDHTDRSEFARRHAERQREFPGNYQPGCNPEKAVAGE